MNIVDSDRLHFIKESGYHNTQFVKMKPDTCTPKNNIIIARKTNFWTSNKIIFVEKNVAYW